MKCWLVVFAALATFSAQAASYKGDVKNTTGHFYADGWKSCELNVTEVSPGQFNAEITLENAKGDQEDFTASLNHGNCYIGEKLQRWAACGQVNVPSQSVTEFQSYRFYFKPTKDGFKYHMENYIDHPHEVYGNRATYRLDCSH